MPLLHWLTRDEDIHRAARAPYRLLEEAPGQVRGKRLRQGEVVQDILKVDSIVTFQR